jgi:hypothetical protein
MVVPPLARIASNHPEKPNQLSPRLHLFTKFRTTPLVQQHTEISEEFVSLTVNYTLPVKIPGLPLFKQAFDHWQGPSST